MCGIVGTAEQRAIAGGRARNRSGRPFGSGRGAVKFDGITEKADPICSP
jgi:hypothetical protein